MTTLYAFTVESWYASARIGPTGWRPITYVEMDRYAALSPNADESRALRFFYRAYPGMDVNGRGVHMLRVSSAPDCLVVWRAPVAGDDDDRPVPVRSQRFECDQ